VDRLSIKSELAEEVRPIAPAVKPELAASKDGYVKVTLSFLTSQPQHLRSLLLYHTCNIKAPYTEEVSILLPRMRVFALLETFIPQFEYLQKSGLVSNSAELQGFSIADEDSHTLAYLF
jgi:hypothetical protein